MKARIETKRGRTVLTIDTTPEKRPQSKALGVAARKQLSRDRRLARGLCRDCGKRWLVMAQRCRQCAVAHNTQEEKQYRRKHPPAVVLPRGALEFARKLEGWERTAGRTGTVLERLTREKRRPKWERYE